MKRKPFPGIIGGLLGFIAGAVGGAYLGLVLGGTFLGSLDIYENTGFEGYELAAYVGAAIGSITAIFIGVVLAYRITKRREKNYYISRRFHMKAYIDKDGCIACGVCVAICPAVFQIGADGLAEVYMDDIPESFKGSVEEAMDSCPVSVITIE